MGDLAEPGGTWVGGVEAAGATTCRAKCTCGWRSAQCNLGKAAMALLLAHMKEVHGG